MWKWFSIDDFRWLYWTRGISEYSNENVGGEFVSVQKCYSWPRSKTWLVGAIVIKLLNILLFQQIYGKALAAVERFYVIGIMEEFNTTVELLYRRLNLTSKMPKVVNKERPKLDMKVEKATVIYSNSVLLKRAAVLNMFDIQLYRYGKNELYIWFSNATDAMNTLSAVARFCKHLSVYPDLLNRVNKNGFINCSRPGTRKFEKTIVLDDHYS